MQDCSRPAMANAIRNAADVTRADTLLLESGGAVLLESGGATLLESAP